jgi:hypothetical protein
MIYTVLLISLRKLNKKHCAGRTHRLHGEIISVYKILVEKFQCWKTKRRYETSTG